MDSKKLLSKARAGDRLALARMITKVENRDHDLAHLIAELYPLTGSARIVGITGPPGAGKSTLADRLTSHLRKANKKVAIVAVDPSSPFSGGAILGDRIRMQRHTGDSGVYIRSIGTRGKHGGLSHSTKEVVLLLDAVGFDYILVETAGVGQTELDILKLAQTVLVILVPESGDSIQMMKAGLMEIADVFCVNKADRPEADRLVRELKNMIGLDSPVSGSPDWTMPVHKTEAIRDKGVGEVLESVLRHLEFLVESGRIQDKSRQFMIDEIEDILIERLRFRVRRLYPTQRVARILQDLEARKLDPYRAAKNILTKKTDSYR